MANYITTKNKEQVDNAALIRYSEFENGHACYVDALCEEGFNFENSIVIDVDFLPENAEYVAIENHSAFWCRPSFGKDLNNVPNLTQELLAFDGTTWHCIVPVVDTVFKSVMCGKKIIMSTNTNDITKCENQLAYVYEKGTDPHKLVESCVTKAAKMRSVPTKIRSERTFPEMFEYLGWCSWDSMHIHVCHEGLVEKAQEFSDKNVPIKFAILDDMWANIPSFLNLKPDHTFDEMVHYMHRGKMECFEGAPDRFPQGVKAAIDDIKALGIDNVGIWFPTTGYWKGFLPGGKDAQFLGSVLGETDEFVWMHAVDSPDETMLIVKSDKESTEKFFDELCGRVKSWGGDFVKIDNQGFHKCYRYRRAIGQSSANVQAGIDKAVTKHFNGAMINCMGMANECMFNRPDTAVSRCSDDFSPESREWFAKNILQCSYNSLLQGQMYYNDWDMWWTDDEQAFKNSICRAISGGPIYVSDKIGRTNPEILKPLSLGNGRILRGDLCAAPTADCLTVDPTCGKKIFKIQNKAGANGVMAVFNVDRENRSVSGSVSPSDLPCFDGSITTFAYYEFFTKKTGFIKYNEKIDVILENNDQVCLYSFVPCENSVAALGRADLFMGVCATTKCEIKNNTVSLTLAEGGTICVAIGGNKKAACVKANGKVIDFKQEDVKLTFECAPCDTEIEIILQ